MGTKQGMQRLPGGAGKVKVRSQVTIYLNGCGQVKLVDGNLAVVAVSNVKCVPGQDVVTNLLRWSPILEDDRDCVFAV